MNILMHGSRGDDMLNIVCDQRERERGREGGRREREREKEREREREREDKLSGSEQAASMSVCTVQLQSNTLYSQFP